MPQTTEPELVLPGRSAASLTYAEVNAIFLGLQKVDGKIDNLHERLTELKGLQVDHEVRIRQIEKAVDVALARKTGKDMVWQWIWGAAISVAMLSNAFLSHFLK